MKKTIIMGIILLMGIISTFGQNPLGFNYQSVIRNAEGVVIANQDVDILINIVQSTADGSSVYAESHNETTNAFGLVNLVIGEGTTTSGNFTTIDWGADNYFLALEIDIDNSGTYTEIGTTQLLSVPYANYAFSGNAGLSAYEVWISLGNQGTEDDFINSLTGPQGEQGTNGPSAYEVWISLGNEGTEEDFINSLTGSSGTTSWADNEISVTTNKNVGVGTDNPTSSLQVVAPENQKAGDPIFEIKNTSGKTVFAVYQNEVKVFIDDTTTASGFTVNSRNAVDETEEIMAVGPKQTTVYVSKNTGKESFGGFAISGRTTTKQVEDLFTITPDLTQFYIKEPSDKESFGGFAISGRTTTKEDIDILSITPSLTEFYVEEPSKAAFGGFAVSGRTTTKEEGSNFLNITPALTKFTIEEPAKESFGGFAISGRTTTKEEIDVLSITPSLTEFYIEEPSKATFGGFAVSGRTTTKAEGSNLLNITPALTKFTIEQPAKESFGGFAISGRTTTKEEVDVLAITPDYTRFYIDEVDSKESFGGFAVSGRTTTKGTNDEIFKIIPGLTEVFIDGEPSKESFGGFAVSGRTTTKESGLYDVFKVQPNKTEVYVKESADKSLPEGFSIFGLGEDFIPTELFAVTEGGTFVNTTMAIAPKVITNAAGNSTQSTAFVEGEVTDDNGLEITEVGFIYSLTPTPNENLDFTNPSIAGMVFGDAMNPSSFYASLQYLTPGTTYYFRAFARNIEGLIGYGTILQFTTEDPFNISIDVLDDATSESISNATITLQESDSPIVITNPEGVYTFAVAGGNYNSIVSAPGYYEEFPEINVEESNSYEVRLTAAPPKVTFNITNPITFAELSIVDQEPIYFEEGQSNYTYLENGVYNYVLNADGYNEYTGSFTVAGVDQTIEITLIPVPTRTVTFNVTFSDGETIGPANGANVTVMLGVKGDKNYYYNTITTDELGQATFTNVPEGPGYIYDISYFQANNQQGSISTAGDQTINIELTQGGK